MTTPYQETHPIPQVAIIGTGTMGTAMARRLLASGFGVSVWSRHPEATMALVELGAAAYDRAADAVSDADVVISMLTDGDVTAQVMLGNLALQEMRVGSAWVQMATIGTGATDWLAAQARARRPDVAFVDAPVSGSRQPAEDGHLLILASGPQETAERLAPIFGALGRATMWLGPAGAGSRMKLVLNTWLAFQTEGAAEASALAEQLGIPGSALLTALTDNPLASPFALAKLARMTDQDYHPDFTIDWALKDLDLVVTAAGTTSAPVAGAIAERWRQLVGQGASGLDVSAARKGLGPTARSEVPTRDAPGVPVGPASIVVGSRPAQSAS